MMWPAYVATSVTHYQHLTKAGCNVGMVEMGFMSSAAKLMRMMKCLFLSFVDKQKIHCCRIFFFDKLQTR